MEEKINSTLAKLIELNGTSDSEDLGGVHFRNIQYYDIGNIGFINNTGILELLDLIKTWSELGKEVCFVNAKPPLKEKIIELQLEKIILFI